MIMKKVIISFIIVLMVFGILYYTSRAKERTKIIVKIATLAPKGSMSTNIMENFRAKGREITNNEVDLKVYWGGVQGDENNVLRKIRLKQLHGGLFTSLGLGQIVPEVRVTEIPYLFRNSDEVRYVRERLADTMNTLFEDKGYIVLGWFDNGFLYTFSNVPINSVEIMKRQKYWLPEGDASTVALFDALDISPIPLSIIDVLTSISTNLIN